MKRIRHAVLAALAAGGLTCLEAAVPQPSPLADKVVRHPDLAIAQVLEPVAAPSSGLGADHVFQDPRAGRIASLILSQPVIPGTGAGNDLEWPAPPEGGAAIRDAVWRGVIAYLERNERVLRVDARELSAPRVDLLEKGGLILAWSQRRIGGIPVRDSSVTAVVSHGNLVLLGLESWGDAPVPRPATIAAAAARDVVVNHVHPFVVEATPGEPRLEYVPMVRGDGVDYRLVWAVRATVRGDLGSWEGLVDAASGELLAFEDRNQYASRHAFGGVYPVSNDQRPPDGIEQAAWPLPFLKLTTGAGPMTTNSSGAFACAAGNAWTGLAGAKARITDGCGAVSEASAAGDLDLGFGPTPGATDCVVPTGHSPGDTKAARTAFFHATRANEQAAGYLPANVWLATPIQVNTNIDGSCNAFFTGNSINFYRVNGPCRNMGENPGVVVHEWGHGMDANGVNPNLAQPFEGIADVHSFLRLGLSCIGRGVFTNTVCAGYGDPCVGDPTSGCTGRRDIDFAGHACGRPHTITWIQSGFPAGHCTDGLPRPACPTGTPGPCGRLVHCESHVVSETAFDLARRDLPAAGFDPATAHELTARLFILGSQAVTAWYTCAVGGGCAAPGGYLLTLAADDDDGNLANGTPHMTAIRAAFERHQIHCATPTPVDSGCAGGPTLAPVLTAAGGPERVDLSWTAVPNSAKYYVYRNDDVAGCDLGRVKIAEVTGTSYADLDLPGGHPYSYAVIPVGANAACFGRASNCASATPSAEPCATTADFALSCNPSSLPVPQGGTSTTSCRVTSANAFAAPVDLSCANLPPSVTCAYNPGSVTPAPNGAAWSTLTVTVGGSVPSGSYTFQAVGTSGALTRSVTINLGVGSVAVAPHALALDADGNGVLEPNESAYMTPSWRNIGQTTITLAGRTGDFTGPPGPVYQNVVFLASYGTILPGGQGSCGSSCYQLGIQSGARPVTHWDATIRESLGPPPLVASMDWTLHVGDSFSDVPTSNPFYPFIETVLHRNVTGGCTGTAYCPAASTTREQMAVFVLVSKEPPGYAPPACVAGSEMFGDVPASSPFCRWIEELARRGVVSGCGGGNYCPASSATREQMAVFVLRTLDPALNPPSCAPPNLYGDVPETSPFCRWIEELTNRGVVTGCGGGNYCPTADVSREQMSVFLAATFGLALYGP